MLGDRFGVIQRRIHHHHPFLRGGFNIYIVIADAVLGDNHQVPRPFQQFFVDFGHPDDDGMRLRNVIAQRFSTLLRQINDIGFLPQDFQSGTVYSLRHNYFFSGHCLSCFPISAMICGRTSAALLGHGQL